MPEIDKGSVWVFGEGDDREILVVDRVGEDYVFFTDGGAEDLDQFHPPAYNLLLPAGLFSDMQWTPTRRSPHPGPPPEQGPIKRKGRLLFTMGIARSGKSTWCTRWSQFLEELDIQSLSPPVYPRAIVCGDDIRLAIHGERFNKDAEPLVWALHTYQVKSLLSRGHDVIIDGTNTTEGSLQRILSVDADAEFRLFDVDPEECKRRARECGYDDLVDRGVIDRHYRQLCEMKAETGGIAGVVERIRGEVRRRWARS